jgi:hypothetical protein
MVKLDVEGDRVVVEVLGAHKLWAFKRRISFPRDAVVAARRAPPDALAGWWKGWRVPGTMIPGVFVAGTYYKDGERHFWDVRRADRAIEIDLAGVPYDRLVVEVADPDAALAQLA